MVSDTVSAALIGVLGALGGTVLGLVAEPIRTRFARKTQHDQLRQILYGELVIKLEMVVSICAYMERNYISFIFLGQDKPDITDWAKSTNKLELLGRPVFPDEAQAQAQYYQLASQEFDLLAPAYNALRTTINVLNKFGWASFDNIYSAKDDFHKVERELTDAIYPISHAFEGNARILEKLDAGTLFKDWHRLVQEPRYQKYFSEAGL